MTQLPDVATDSGDYYFCMTHREVERGQGCRAADRMGPYPSAEAAASWQQSVEQRNEAADKADREDEED
ncbi:MAG: hypothetical protein QOJ11_4213 [Frankiales bacterium]|jgi:hypothetical protein|nr:hypothetical protein [Frankiales bacterium]